MLVLNAASVHGLNAPSSALNRHSVVRLAISRESRTVDARSASSRSATDVVRRVAPADPSVVDH